MPIKGKLEVSIKFTELPTEVETDKNGWKKFKVDCEGHTVTVHMRARMWMKIEEAKQKYPTWRAVVTGKAGLFEGQDFLLLEPNVQVFGTKPQPPSDPD